MLVVGHIIVVVVWLVVFCLFLMDVSFTIGVDMCDSPGLFRLPVVVVGIEDHINPNGTCKPYDGIQGEYREQENRFQPYGEYIGHLLSLRM